MDTIIKGSDEVRTLDGYKLGIARCLHYRPEEDVDIGAQLYPIYLEVENFDLGDGFYVPLVFVDGRDPEDDTVVVGAKMKEVMDRTWTRMPDFVARMEGRRERLPEDADQELPGEA